MSSLAIEFQEHVAVNYHCPSRKQKQATRLATCTRFTLAKHTVLLSTDLAARGLDFPAADWVLQPDAPENAETYIHRVEGMA